MKKRLFIGLVAILGLTGCTRNQEIDTPDANLSLYARTESPADTRTVVESGVHVIWEPGDEIAVFMGEKSAKFTTDITAASGTATFKGTFGDATWPEEVDLWAVYPFSEDVVFDGETITTTLPSEQMAREGSFGKDMNLSIAHSNSSTLQFYNVGGGIRFSVTEEGVKKVMFEGLSGEILSGKVKLGLDENGKPVIKEVTEGSQFITLLPPLGKETFEPGAWYYIVAIPGSLEGGYKLRFYKDSDYARKTSEKAVEIKRSIFGSLEKADMGIEYEATTTHFPQTREEWEKTESRISIINTSVQTIFENDDASENRAIRVANEALKIEGVISSEPSQNGGLVYLKMQNGVFVNVLLNNTKEVFGGTSSSKESTINNVVPRKTETNADIPASKKALLLVPGMIDTVHELSDHGLDLYRNIQRSFSACGYEVSIYATDATLDMFRGDKLKEYDAIYINTHGTNDAKLADGTLTTALMTTTEISTYSEEEFDYLPTYVLCERESSIFYWISTAGLKFDQPVFNDSWVFLHACNSLTSDDMYTFFLESGASACSGFLSFASIKSSVDFAACMIDALASGMEVETASTWAQNHSINMFGEPWVQWTVLDNYGMHRHPDKSSCYLFDAKPYCLTHSSDGSLLYWKAHPHTGEYIFNLYVQTADKTELIATIDENEINEYYYDSSSLPPGDYVWFVEAILRYSGEVVETFKSDVDHFTVKEPRPGGDLEGTEEDPWN